AGHVRDPVLHLHRQRHERSDDLPLRVPRARNPRTLRSSWRRSRSVVAAFVRAGTKCPPFALLHYVHPTQMPSASEILGVLIVIFVIWFVLKLARVAVRLILFLIGITLLIGALYFLFVR